MTKIYITRHGQCYDNARGILNGLRDKSLTEYGKKQAKIIAEHIKNKGLIFDKIYTSPLRRTYETAHIISTYMSLTNSPVKMGPLIERDFGVMTGKRIADVEKLCAPDILKTGTITYFLNPKNGETFPDIEGRAKKVIDTVCTLNKGRSVLLVTHGDIGKMIYAVFYKLSWMHVLESFHFGNCELLLLSSDSEIHNSHIFNQDQINC